MVEGILWVLFTLGCIVVSGLVLLQEGKGGGLGEAFGGAGAQTFGVKAQGVAKVTGYLICGLVVTAIVITKMRSGESAVTSLLDSSPPAQTAPAEAGAVPVDDGTGAGDGGGDEPSDG